MHKESLVFALVIVTEDELLPLHSVVYAIPFQLHSFDAFYGRFDKNQFVLFATKRTWFVRATQRLHATAMQLYTDSDDNAELFVQRKCSRVGFVVVVDRRHLAMNLTKECENVAHGPAACANVY